MKRFRYTQLLSFGIVLLVISALSLAACMPVQPVTPTAGNEATAVPTVELTHDPTDEPVEGAGIDAVTATVTEMLALQLQISADEIEVVSVEPVEWPDSCLGVQDPNTMCAQVITPGYVVVLSAGGQQYEYHTNDDGSSVVVAPTS